MSVIVRVAETIVIVAENLWSGVLLFAIGIVFAAIISTY
jgi:hypothetical protein